MRHPARHKNNSVACFKCRKKKQKCVGGDKDTPCVYCVKTNTKCQIDASTDGRRRWHSKVKESRRQQQLLENLLDTIRFSPTSQVNDLLAVIRSSTSLEEVQEFVDGSLTIHQSPFAEEAEPSTRESQRPASRGQIEALTSSNISTWSIEQSFQEHRELLRSIGASVDLPDHLARQLERLLANSPDPSESRMELLERSFKSISFANRAIPLSTAGSVSSNFSLKDAELLSQPRSDKAFARKNEVQMHDINLALPPIQLPGLVLPPLPQGSSSGSTSYDHDEPHTVPHFLLPPLLAGSGPSTSSNFFPISRNQAIVHENNLG